MGTGTALPTRRPTGLRARRGRAPRRHGTPTRPAAVVHPRRRSGRRSGSSSPRPASCTSKASSPRPRWRPSPPTSTTRSRQPSATTARRGGRAPRRASGTRRGSSASTRSRRHCASCLRSDRFRALGTFTERRVHATQPRRRRLRRRSAEEDRRRRRHLRRELAQGLRDGRPQPPLLRTHRRHLGDRRRTRERRARRGRRFAPRQRRARSASTGSTSRACRSPRAPATSRCTARAPCT